MDFIALNFLGEVFHFWGNFLVKKYFKKEYYFKKEGKNLSKHYFKIFKIIIIIPTI
jgi:hypothetical protein